MPSSAGRLLRRLGLRVTFAFCQAKGCVSRGLNGPGARSRGLHPIVLLTLLTLALTGCSSGNQGKIGDAGFVEGFAGMAAAEEPQAVLVARDILSSGGSAADAVVAMSLAQAVTLPSAAGLGGGGACAVWDPKTNHAETITFMAGGGLPTVPRGLFVVHAKYGRLRWESVVQPAESLARFGSYVSRALVTDIAAAGPAAGAALPMLAGKREGDKIEQPELAGLLGRLRVRGPGDFYVGETAQDLARAITAVGGRVTPEQIRAFSPATGAGHSQPVGDAVAHATAPLAGGSTAVPAAETVFIAVDGTGGIAACGQTMGQPFGLGHTAPGTGMLVADLSGRTPPPAAIVVNSHSKEPRAALGATGNQAGATVATLLSAVQAGKMTAPQALVGGTGMQLITCGSGSMAAGRCTIASDPQAHGLAMAFGHD